jgi:hypothetical protein
MSDKKSQEVNYAFKSFKLTREKTTPESVSVKLSQEVPDLTMPQVYHYRGEPWIRFGVNNLWPQTTVTPVYNSSAMTRSCINSKWVYVNGEGLRTKDPALELVLKRANNQEEGWNDIFQRASLDQLIYGGYYLEIIWNKTGDRIMEIYNMDFNDMRSGVIDPETDCVEWFYYSADWGNYKKPLYKPLAIKAFDPEQAHLYPRQILFVRNYNPAQKYYPLPDWSGSITAGSVDVMIDSFHYANLQQGLVPSLFIQMNNGIPDPDTQKEIYDDIAATFSGVDSAGKFFLSFAADKDHGAEVTPIESANDEYYINLSQRISQTILTGHRITSPLLLGIKDIGGAGLSNNKDEILVASEHFSTTVIKPIQKNMLKAFDKILRLSGYNTELYIEPLRLFNDEGEQVGEASVDAIV